MNPNGTNQRSPPGRTVYARNIGVSDAHAEAMMVARAGTDFTREAFNAAGGVGWHSNALTDRDRSIAAIAALVSQQVTDDRLVTYLHAARRSGLDEAGLPR